LNSKELGFDIEDSHMGGRELRVAGNKVGVQLAKSLIEPFKVSLVSLLWSLETFEDEVALGLDFLLHAFFLSFQFSFVQFFRRLTSATAPALSVFRWTTSGEVLCF
jgi:hypothetical protein